MRTLKRVLLVAGAALLAVLVYRTGAEPIVATLGQLTWWQFALVCLPYGLTTVVDTLGWRFAFRADTVPFPRLAGARLAGEALNLVTAVGQVGGEAAKAWLVRRDVPYAESVPSIVIAKTTITIAQALFLALGIGAAWTLSTGGPALIETMAWLLLVEVLAVGGFLAAQVTGVVGRAGRLVVATGLARDAGHARALDRALRDYYRRDWRRFALSVGFHLLGWIFSAVEALAAAWALGIPISLVGALTVEALGSAVRFASFLVPASLGAYEGGNAAAFAALGHGAAAGLAFSFVRRARQVVWIVIGLLVLAGMRWADARHRARASRPPSMG
ncbi:MAG TPA: lysylphosphatidylglycerol synthase domain-containing protein [Candidatus Tectomicrobia bacterium]|nr:lysylphosphatidylglycerol synthase domain-containing protein [Candidatus Tectomicrobia bacterium]